MTLVLELPPDLERRVEEEAAREGVPAAEYAVRLLDRTLPSTTIARDEEERASPQPMPKTGAELVAYWERLGLVGSRPDIEDSVATARALRERSQYRDRSRACDSPTRTC